MSAAQHTPGPWSVDFVASGYSLNCSAGDNSATVRGGDVDCALAITIADTDSLAEQSEANAHLIAAAPDLLAACGEALEWLDDVCNPYSEHASRGGVSVRSQIEAAIEKAKGVGE